MSLDKCDVVLLDVEGTVAPISFVYDVLFPYAASHLDGFVREEWDTLNDVVELLSNSERLEDMGRNSLIASGYAQQRADEASINLIELLKTYRNINVA